MKKIPYSENGIVEFAPEKIKVLVFDVDDTITRGTIDIKAKVWCELFAEKMDLLQKARELYEYTGKGDRYNMIAYIIGESQKDCKENELVKIWADKFEQMSLFAIRKHGIHPDDLRMLSELKNNFNYLVYLLSATPEESVAGNIKYFETIYPNLVGVFDGIIGTPMKGGKAGELLLLADKHQLAPDELVMIGDGQSDYSGAFGAMAQFIAIIPEGKSDKWSTESFPKISSIAELLSLF